MGCDSSGSNFMTITYDPETQKWWCSTGWVPTWHAPTWQLLFDYLKNSKRMTEHKYKCWRDSKGWHVKLVKR